MNLQTNSRAESSANRRTELLLGQPRAPPAPLQFAQNIAPQQSVFMQQAAAKASASVPKAAPITNQSHLDPGAARDAQPAAGTDAALGGAFATRGQWNDGTTGNYTFDRIARDMNATPDSRTGTSPYEMVYGRSEQSVGTGSQSQFQAISAQRQQEVRCKLLLDHHPL